MSSDLADSANLSFEVMGVTPQTVLASTESFTVLLIEDNLGDARLVQEMFREVAVPQVQLLQAETLAAAIVLLNQEPISIILLDLSLPDVDGLQSLLQIHQIVPDLPVVVMSGLQDDSVAIRAVQLGAQDYLIKGQLESHLLVRSLRYAIERQRMQTTLKQAQQEMHQLYQQVQSLNTGLEVQVQERTQQLAKEKALLEATLKSLYTSEARFRALVRHAMDGIAVLDANGTILYESPSVEHRLGYLPEEMIGKSVFDLLHPDDRESTMRAFQGCLQQPGMAMQVEYRCRHKDGTWRHIESLGTNLLHDPSVRGVVMNASDITERKRYEADLKKARDAAEAGSRAKSEFLAMMSHELRTPLNAILGLSELLRQEIFGALNLKQREYMTCIHSSGEHLLSLINDILDLSKVEAGKEELILTPVVIADLCAYCLSVVRERAIEGELKLTSRMHLQGHTCFADERRLRQMLLNLLSNAIKFTPEGEVSLTVADEGQWITFAVSDTGIGIAPEHLETIFEPFHQVDSSLDRHFDGTGLGLALTSRLAQLHGGRVTVTSTIGEGSCFTLYLPKVPIAESQTPEDDERGSLRPSNEPQPVFASSLALPPMILPQSEQVVSGATGLASAGRVASKTILLIEGETSSALLVQDYLLSLNYTVEQLTEANTSIDRISQLQPDLIILGVHRAQEAMDLQLLMQLRADPKLASIPVIVMTALAMAGDRERLLAAGADAYLSKPILMSQLERMLARYL